MSYDIELNGYKIDVGEDMCGRADPAGHEDTLNRFPSEIWNRLRSHTIFADGTSKIRMIGEIFEQAGANTSDTSYDTLAEKGIEIVDGRAVVVFGWSADFSGWDNDGSMLGFLKVKIDDVIIDQGDTDGREDLFFGNITGGVRQSGAFYDRSFVGEFIGAGLHTISIEWATQASTSFGLDSNLFFYAIVHENGSKE